MIDQITSNFSFTTLWSPLYIIFSAVVVLGYFLTIGKYRDKFKNATAVPFKRKVCFVLGVITFYLGFGGPLYLVGHLLFSAHMIQMALVYLIAPALIIIGLPDWILRPLLNNKYVKKPFQFFTSPFIALLLFNGLFSFYHFPEVYDYFMSSYLLHTIFQFSLFVAAFFMWWPIVCPVPEMDRLSGLKKLGYIFANGVLLTPACALIIFSNSILYETYTNPILWANAVGYCLPPNTPVPMEMFDTFRPTNPLNDQQLGGVIMKIIQEIVYGSALAFIFTQWLRKERSENDEDLSMSPQLIQPKRT
jgi:putative membrane protein